MELLASIAIIIGASYTIYKIRKDRNIFKIRYLNPNEAVAPENMLEYTAARMDTGTAIVSVSIRPNIGVDLEGINFVFFDRSIIPLRHGRRRIKQDIQVNKIEFWNGSLGKC